MRHHSAGVARWRHPLALTTWRAEDSVVTFFLMSSNVGAIMEHVSKILTMSRSNKGRAKGGHRLFFLSKAKKAKVKLRSEIKQTNL